MERDEDDCFDDEYEPDEFEEAVSNCHGFLDGKHFMCGAHGSEDCDECPFNRDIGLTLRQIEQRDMDELERLSDSGADNHG